MVLGYRFHNFSTIIFIMCKFLLHFGINIQELFVSNHCICTFPSSVTVILRLMLLVAQLAEICIAKRCGNSPRWIIYGKLFMNSSTVQSVLMRMSDATNFFFTESLIKLMIFTNKFPLCIFYYTWFFFWRFGPILLIFIPFIRLMV